MVAELVSLCLSNTPKKMQSENASGIHIFHTITQTRLSSDGHFHFAPGQAEYVIDESEVDASAGYLLSLSFLGENRIGCLETFLVNSEV